MSQTQTLIVDPKYLESIPRPSKERYNEIKTNIEQHTQQIAIIFVRGHFFCIFTYQFDKKTWQSDKAPDQHVILDDDDTCINLKISNLKNNSDHNTYVKNKVMSYPCEWCNEPIKYESNRHRYHMCEHCGKTTKIYPQEELIGEPCKICDFPITDIQ